MPNCYNGKILRVDLTTKKLKVEELNLFWLEEFLKDRRAGK